MSIFPPETIRNFSIIAHIGRHSLIFRATFVHSADHGKTTLSTRLLEETNTITSTPDGRDPVYLDKLTIEKERGITVKAQTASYIY